MDLTTDCPTIDVAPPTRLPSGPGPASAAFDTMVRAMHQLAQRIAVGDAGAGAALQALLARLQAHPDPRCPGLYVFGSALAQRLSGDMAQTANLYLRRFDVPQIELFNLLGRRMPMAALATAVANAAIARAIRGQAHPTVIDIGIGTGRQIAGLIDSLAAAGRLPPRMTVIGIEPGGDALAVARATLTATAARLGMALHFHGFAACSEVLSDSDWQAVQARCTGRPAVNAAFALHHIADDAQGHDQRDRVLRRLHALQPRCLVLSEPDVDHREPGFLARYHHCFRHFGAVFGLLDALDLTQAERDALKVGFFGREIHDILGSPEARRTERHETTRAWMGRLALAGFQVEPPAPGLPASGHPAVSAVARDTHVALMAGDEALVSVLVAAPSAIA